MRMKPKSTVHNPRALLYKRFTDLETSTAFGTLYRTTDGGVTKYWAFRGLDDGFVEVTEHIERYSVIQVQEGQLFTYADYFYQYTASWTGQSFYYHWTRHDLSDLLANGEEVSIPVSLNGAGVFQKYSTRVDLPYFTAAPPEITIINNSDYQLMAFKAYFVIGNKKYTYERSSVFTESAIIQMSGETIGDNVQSILINGNVNPLAYPPLPNTTYDNFTITVKFRINGIQTLASEFGAHEIARYQTNKYYLAGSFDYMIRGSINSEDTQPLKGNIMHLHSFEIKHFDDRINIDHDDLVVIDGHLYGVENLAYDVKRSPKPYTVYFATLNSIK